MADVVEERCRLLLSHLAKTEARRRAPPVKAHILEDSPAVLFVDWLLENAVVHRASDVHIEPFEGEARVRFRVDGVLISPYRPFPLGALTFILSRLKVMAGIDSTEKRMAQDGRISYVAKNGETFDIRLSTLPLYEGEKAVLRLLPREAELLSVKDLDFSSVNQQRFQTLIQGHHGMVLVTGPVNSGKTTTLYAALRAMNSPRRHIMTIEDPPECRLPGIGQMPVREKAGMTYAKSLRALLRADIDAICLGEIRDPETAQIAVRAALTGHLLLSTLHTSDAPRAVFRLLDMGVEPYLLAPSLKGVLAQRLVRRICPLCKEKREVRLPSWLGKPLGGSIGLSWQGKGCTACNGTGYLGRMALHELLTITPALEMAILQEASWAKLQKLAREAGLRTLLEDGISKAQAGKTTFAEVCKVLEGDAEEVNPEKNAEPPASDDTMRSPRPTPDLRAMSISTRGGSVTTVE